MIDPIVIKETQVHHKGWGKEVWIANNAKYCGKILYFNKGAEFSMHYHMLKHETFYILSGKIVLRGFDLSDATPHEETYGPGTVIVIPAGNPHKIFAIEETVVIEVSTQHFEDDSYRIQRGDSQKTVFAEAVRTA